MTLSSILSSNFGHNTGIYDRGEHHISYSPPWKGGGSKGNKGTQSALSALTLLAFLFFLNMLQSCLKEQMQDQSPLTIMMTTQTTTTTTEGQRHRRDVEEEEKQLKGDNAIQAKKNIKEQITGLARHGDNYVNTDYELLVLEEPKYEMDSNKEDSFSLEVNTMTAVTTESKLPDRTESNSPWLQSVICCNILPCSTTWKEKKQNQYGDYIRKLISHLCPNGDRFDMKGCKKCN